MKSLFPPVKILPSALLTLMIAIAGLSAARAADDRQAGDEFFNGSRWADAINAYTRALRGDPRNPYLFNQRGRAHARLEQWHPAVMDFRTALQLDPRNTTLRDNLHGALIDKGISLTREGGQIWAVNDFSEAIELRRDHRAGWFLRGIARGELGEFEPAIEDLRQALALDSENKHTRLHFGKVLHRSALKHLEAGRLQDAVSNIFEAIAVDGGKPEFHVARGDAYARLKRPADAAADYRAALKLDPKDRAARRGLMHVLGDQAAEHLEARKWPAAIAAYTELIAADSDNAEHWNRRGRAWFATFQGDRRLTTLLRALDDFERATTLAPDQATYRQDGAAARAAVEFAFYDEFNEDRAAPAEPWRLDLNGVGSPDLYAVRGGRLVLQTFEPADLGRRVGQPFFLLDRPLPEEDYVVMGEVQMAPSTRRERLAFGIFKNPENHVLGAIGFLAGPGGASVSGQLEAARWLDGKRVATKKKALADFPPDDATRGAVRFRIVKRGTSYIVAARPRGATEWLELDPIEDLHPGGQFVLGFHQDGTEPAEMSTAMVNWIRVVKVR